eukprot:XP_011677309.1 PREDICTED: transient receptor potential cation channel subfamily A member 1 homolog isoform X2 [Strongylocentrotus purpuratus]
MACHGSDRVDNDCYLDDEETSVVKLARAGQLEELQQLLNDMDPGDIFDSVSEHDAKDNSALHYAARIDNLDMVKLLVQHGADVDAVGEAGRCPLHLAAGTKNDLSKVVAAKRMSTLPDEGVVKFLLSSDAYENATDIRGRNPLHIATLNGNTEAVFQLLSKSDTELNNADNRKMTPLLLACLHGEIDIAILLIDKGADLMVYDENSDTPLHIAINEGNKKIVRKIIEKAKETDKLTEILIEQNSDGVAPIHLAVRGGHTELVQISLEHGLIAYQTTMKDDDTPLHEACSAGHLDIVTMLSRNYGADINAKNLNGETPLHHACKENHQIVAEFLFEERADIRAKNNEKLTPLQVATNSGSFDTIIGLLGRIRRSEFSVTTGDTIRDAASDLLKWAATENKANTLQLLLHHGVMLHWVNDEEISEFILDAAKKGHTETVAALIRWKRSEVVDKCDDVGNTPLHYASEAGHDQTVQELIKAKATVNVTNSDDAYKRSPLHLAAANGWIRTVKQLLKANARVDKTDLDEITPLHLACKKGHIDMVKLLVCEEKVDIVLRDKQGLNCLDYAIDNGHENIADFILSHDKWREVMSVSILDDDTYERTTPMRKLIKNMPDIAKRVMDRCITVSSEAGPTDSEFWVQFDYEFLEDSFSNWDRPKDSDDDEDNDDDEHKTEETIFTITPKGQSTSDSELHFTIEGNTVKQSQLKSKKIPETPKAPTGDQYDAKGHLEKSARPYTTSSKAIAANHPLNIMVTSERADLLGHPLVSSLLNYKWSRVGQYVFWASFGSYLLFVTMLTGYVIVVPPSYYVRHANQSAGVSWFVNGEQRWTAGFHEATIFFFGRIGDWIILVLSLINLLREDWQWQCGAVAVFLAWINLILFIRRFSGLGIYVIMFVDILRTFMKFVLILILFVVAFAMAFYTLLMNQQPFHSVQYSFAKTFVMMIGELDFGTIFHSQNYLGTENTLADGEEDFFLTSVFYKGVTYTTFLLFLVIMSILIMNLLVGLAVDDIHAIQEKAKLHRLVMQVELVMELQGALPIFIWRSAVIRFNRFNPNGSCCSGLQKWYHTLTGDQKLLRHAIQVSNKTIAQGGFMHQEVTTDQLFTNLKYRLKKIDTKVETVSERVEEEGPKIAKISVEQEQMKERFERLENKIDALLNHIKVKWDDESKTDAK